MKRSSIAVLGIGATLSLFLGSGLFALVSDSVRSESNGLVSGTYQRPAHDLQVGLVTPDENCADALYEDGPIEAVIGDLGPTLDPHTVIGPHHLCLKNAGTGVGRLYTSFENVFEFENDTAGVPPCQPSEADPSGGGDTTCSQFDAGELRPLLRFGIVENLATSPSCAGFEENFIDVEQLPQLTDADLEPGEICRVQPQVHVNASATDEQRLAAQTDTLIWDIVFTLEDAPNPNDF
jgi:hypothetical protein